MNWRSNSYCIVNNTLLVLSCICIYITSSSNGVADAFITASTKLIVQKNPGRLTVHGTNDDTSHMFSINQRVIQFSTFSLANALNEENDVGEGYSNRRSSTNRRQLLQSSTATIASVALLLINPQASKADIEGVATPRFLNNPDVKATVDTPSEENKNEDEGVKLYSTRSGLKYIELREGTGPSPQYSMVP